VFIAADDFFSGNGGGLWQVEKAGFAGLPEGNSAMAPMLTRM